MTRPLLLYLLLLNFLMYTTFIDCADLAEHLDDPDWVIVDARFDLGDVEFGRISYAKSHIPNAVYAHLDDDMSSAPFTDQGRHPLPSPKALCDLFGRLGINKTKQVVIYDSNGGVYASRLWWMLKYMSHEAVAILNGSWNAWMALELLTRSGEENATTTVFEGSPRYDRLVIADDVLAQSLLIDSRAPARYRGEVEPIDPIAGHIDGAVNYHFANNWDDGKFVISTDELKIRFSELIGKNSYESATFYCGSGVSACYNLLSMSHAGYPLGKLYVGSWSEWCQIRPNSS